MSCIDAPPRSRVGDAQPSDAEIDQRGLVAQAALVVLSTEILADTRLLVAAGREDEVGRATVAIDPDGARLQGTHGAQRPRNAARVHTGSQSVLRVVGQREAFLVVI